MFQVYDKTRIIWIICKSSAFQLGHWQLILGIGLNKNKEHHMKTLGYPLDITDVCHLVLRPGYSTPKSSSYEMLSKGSVQVPPLSKVSIKTRNAKTQNTERRPLKQISTHARIRRKH